MKSISRREFIGSSISIGSSALISSAFPFQEISSSAKTGYAFDPDFTRFENNIEETPQRVEWIHSQLIISGVKDSLSLISPYTDPMEYIQKIHTEKHIEIIDSLNAIADLQIGQVARTAVGYILGAVEAVCEGKVRNAFCCVRPPGHHATNGGEQGYCCYANVVLAALFARERYNIRKILIIDWDYHQGNGTHSLICGDNDILFFDTFFPEMYTTDCNDFAPEKPEYSFPEDSRRMAIRMPCGSSNDDFVRVFESQLIPAAERFQPELVLISSGFDLKIDDFCFNVTASGVSRLTRIVRQIADTCAEGKLVSVLEGGYSDSLNVQNWNNNIETYNGLAQCAENHVKTLITGNEYPETPYFKKVLKNSIHKPINTNTNQILLQNVYNKDGPWRIIITDYRGRVVRRIHSTNDIHLSLNSLHLANGYYYIKISGNTGNFYQSFMVVR